MIALHYSASQFYVRASHGCFQSAPASGAPLFWRPSFSSPCFWTITDFEKS
ncbi:hypothetical protein BUC_2970 [Burkholderia pseudomallei 576]|nr:hypothetical protein BUC_2970 [Burkholderia pseudomallei 576]